MLIVIRRVEAGMLHVFYTCHVFRAMNLYEVSFAFP